MPAYALMVGVPARQIGWMSEFGEQLELDEKGESRLLAYWRSLRFERRDPEQGGCLNMIEFIDLKSQQARIKDKIDAGIQRVLDHGQYILGPEVAELEKRLAEFVGAKYCITCANGTRCSANCSDGAEYRPGR
ncbi:UDP-2-acetamido-2-dideoxy-d-ribo-hex-3-uluronic acid transaminase, wbpE [Pseudomonas putida S11]|nr:UDP-2-acetamido-2-dideoxy-d-ribo-hex-3-uluronic acid transaminase, wbpE [Pseudomonas putida S11]